MSSRAVAHVTLTCARSCGAWGDLLQCQGSAVHASLSDWGAREEIQTKAVCCGWYVREPEELSVQTSPYRARGHWCRMCGNPYAGLCNLSDGVYENFHKGLVSHHVVEFAHQHVLKGSYFLFQMNILPHYSCC